MKRRSLLANRFVGRLLLLGAILLLVVLLFAFGIDWAGHLVATCSVISFLWGTLRPNSPLFGPIRRRSADEESLWLTIDDGPCPKTTPRILEILAARNVRATFFLIGSNAAEHPQLVRQISEAGHQVGNHTSHHLERWFWRLGPARTDQEIREAQDILEGILGTPPRWFRAPVGHFNFFTHPVLRSLDLTMVGWTCRGYDGTDTRLERITRILGKTLRPGAVVLLHEGREISVAVLEQTLRLAHERNLVFRIPEDECQR